MKFTRIYQTSSLIVNATLMLDQPSSHHLLQVLRLKSGDMITVFNGNGGEYQAEIIAIEKKRAIIKVKKFIDIDRESPLRIHLGQGIARGEKMDFIIQKAVELGVTKITPLFTEFSNVKLAGERLQKRVEHWQAVAISACEQSGRNRIPEIVAPISLPNWLSQCQENLKLVLDPDATAHLSNLSGTYTNIALLIGAEGGLSKEEIALAKQYDFQFLQLGPRILRTETAGLAIISALQSRWGDLR